MILHTHTHTLTFYHIGAHQFTKVLHIRLSGFIMASTVATWLSRSPLGCPWHWCSRGTVVGRRGPCAGYFWAQLLRLAPSVTMVVDAGSRLSWKEKSIWCQKQHQVILTPLHVVHKWHHVFMKWTHTHCIMSQWWLCTVPFAGWWPQGWMNRYNCVGCTKLH